MLALDIKNLTKDFPLPERGKYLRAVDGLSLAVEQNCVLGLLGPNGSGKSTTIKILLGLSRPSEGECLLYGESPSSRKVRSRVGYVPDAPYYHRFLSGIELMRFHGRLLGLRRSLREKRGRSLLERFGLADAAERKIAGYSKGMLQRLGFAQALLGDPDLLILDEPTAGVDPVGAAEVGEFITDLKQQGKTVLLCSHLLSQVQDVCDRVGIMNKGRLLAEGQVDDLLGGSGGATLRIGNLDAKTRSSIEEMARRSGATIDGGSGSLEQLFRRLVSEDEEAK